MCDTLATLPSHTLSGNLIFAKNSDREPLEAQEICMVTRKIHSETMLRCTYIEIPQVKETYEIILSKPFQMWGAEMGANEFGLTIGNEAVFTNVKIQKTNSGLTGMDLLRLALERSKNTDEALDCITSLLEKYGQDACGGFKNRNFYYHNSFIIADPEKAYVLETAGKSWAIKQIKKFQSISNGLTIGIDYDRIHLAEEKRYFPFNFKRIPSPFSFSEHFSDFLFTKVGRASIRRSCSTSWLESAKGEVSATTAMKILKSHNLPDPDFNPKRANTASLCMHATGITNPSQTTGSMVAEIRKKGNSTIWLTGTSMPCLSIFIPFFHGTDPLLNITAPSAKRDESLWWKAEKIHRWICQDYQVRKDELLPEINRLQEEFLAKEAELINKKASLEELGKFSKACLESTLSFYSNIIV